MTDSATPMTSPRVRRPPGPVLDAAEQLLLESGPDALTFAQLAQRSGVPQPQLAQDWPAVDAVVEAVAARHLLAVDRALAAPSAPTLQGRLAVLAQAWSAVADPPELYRALDALAHPAVRELLTAGRTGTLAELDAMLRAHPDAHGALDIPASARLGLWLLDGAARGPGASGPVHLLEALERLLQLRRPLEFPESPAQLATPCLVLDKDRLLRNLDRMKRRAASLGVALRPHIKTAKSVEVARLAVGDGGPLTVSTLREAEHFAAHGFRDLVYAVAMVPDRLDRAARLTASGVRVRLFVESLEVARAVAAHPGSFEVLVELDSGENRTGVRGAEALLQIAGSLQQSPTTHLLGVATHGGHSYRARSVAERVAVAEEERRVAVEAAELLREHGFPCPVVSVGSTPTAVHAAHLDGVTELRPGVYTLGDLFQAGIGSHGLDDIACSVLATVLSHRRAAGRLILDAGGLALSKDRSTAGWPFDSGYGLLADAETGELLDGLKVEGVHQEHGEVTGPIPWDRLPVGSRVRVLPNHICMTAAMYDRYHLIESGRVVACWPRINGWRPLDGARLSS